MTTYTEAPASPATGRRAGDFTNLLRAELAKLMTVRSTYWTLLVAFAANIGFAVLAAALLAPRLKPSDLAHVDVVQLAMAGLHLSQVAFGVLGAMIITGEYGTGMVRTTFAAVPRRRTVLAAKGLVFAGTTLVTATVSTLAAYLAFLAALPAHTLTGTALTDPGVARAVFGGGLYLTVYGLLGFGLGALLRSSAAVIATVLGVLFVPPLLLELLPGSWKTTVGPYIPMQSGSQIFVAVRHEAASLAPWTGFGVFCLYAAAALLAGFVVVNRRDA
ncbi:ABC transporter permease [Asanoa sp. NPDC049573]|uniref:ABC transporter permease n=1 Tax=Asanoa sp. NPDC049573 TaxID=3155396 RepID=UPI00341B1E24